MTAERTSASELQKLLEAGRRVTVIDVRPLADVDWAIPGSIHVDAYDALKAGDLGPLGQLNLSLGPVVMVCGMGHTAAIATDLLRARGVEASTLEGGMRAWSLAWNTADLTVAGCEVVQVRRTGKGCLSYIVASRGEAVVIDASVEPDVYVGLLNERGWRLVGVLETHIHADHLSRSKVLAEREGVGLWLPAQRRTSFPFRAIARRDPIAFGGAELVALQSPGHTEESTTYLLANLAAFTGDTLFLTGVGRPDLEGGNRDEVVARARLLHESIRRLLELPADALILPGHVSEPIRFDGRPLTASVGMIRDTVPLARLDQDRFVDAILARIPPSPPNHAQIIELNERGELPKDPGELEAGANRCAIA